MVVLTQGMIDIARNRPDDPIAYMANHMLKQAAEVQSQTEQEAFSNFHRILSEAEEKFNSS